MPCNSVCTVRDFLGGYACQNWFRNWGGLNLHEQSHPMRSSDVFLPERLGESQGVRQLSGSWPPKLNSQTTFELPTTLVSLRFIYKQISAALEEKSAFASARQDTPNASAMDWVGDLSSLRGHTHGGTKLDRDMRSCPASFVFVTARSVSSSSIHVPLNFSSSS